MRENRKKEQEKIIRNIAFSGIFCLGIIILLTILVIFIKNIKSNDTIEGTEVSKKTEITDEGLESTTSEIGKSVNEVKKDEQDEKTKENSTSNTNVNNAQKNTNTTNKDVNTNKEVSSSNKESSNTTNSKNESSSINKENICELEELYQLLSDLGVNSWQLQIALPMGNFAKRPEWLIEPQDIL